MLWEFLVDVWDSVVIRIQDNRRLKKKERKRINGYLNATADVLRGAAGQDLLSLVTYRLSNVQKMSVVRDVSGLQAFNAAQRIFWVANFYEQKIDGGGLCGFLTSEFGYLAPLVPRVLEAIGADGHLELYNGYFSEYKIDVEAIYALEIWKMSAKKKAKAMEKLRSDYNFVAFDSKYVMLEPIEEKLLCFVRENADQIL